MSGCAGAEPFALRVLGDSMYPEFRQGEIIVIEPGACCDDGAYVVALHDGEYIFRQLLVEHSRMYLRPLNDAYPTLRISDLNQIKGRIISKSSGRRQQRKSYL
jgi:phage repressor protein C with HTH and peptisase S24 domain